MITLSTNKLWTNPYPTHSMINLALTLLNQKSANYNSNHPYHYLPKKESLPMIKSETLMNKLKKNFLIYKLIKWLKSCIRTSSCPKYKTKPLLSTPAAPISAAFPTFLQDNAHFFHSKSIPIISTKRQWRLWKKNKI